MNKEQLKEIIENHDKWLRDEDGGERASLYGADNIDEAQLNGCAGDRSRIKSIFVSDKWPITYTKNVLQIECQKHKIEEWREFSDERIAKMDSDALEFWWEFKETIFTIIERHPAAE